MICWRASFTVTKSARVSIRWRRATATPARSLIWSRSRDSGARTSLSASLRRKLQTVPLIELFALRAQAGRDTRAPVLSAMTSSKTIMVKVLFFGAARDASGHEEVTLEINSPADAARARAQILAAHPGSQA